VPDNDDITPSDLAIFKDRLQAKLKELGMSQRELEDKIGCGRGLVSKLFKGRLKLTGKHLVEIYQASGIEGHDLVHGTRLEPLLSSVRVSATSQRVQDLAADNDRLRQEHAASEAVVKHRDQEVLQLRKAVDAETQGTKELERLLASTQHGLDNLDAERSVLERQLAEQRKQAARNLSSFAAAQTDWVTEKARRKKAETLLVQWRDEALGLRGQLAAANELCRRLQSQINNSTPSNPINPILTGLLGIGAGLLLGGGGDDDEYYDE